MTALKTLENQYHLSREDAWLVIQELGSKPKYISVGLHRSFILFRIGLNPTQATEFLKDHGYDNGN